MADFLLAFARRLRLSSVPMPIENFPTLIGRFIASCGAIELIINSAIDQLSTDLLLSREIWKQGLEARLDILHKLLQNRTKLPASDLTALFGDLKSIAHDRNSVAHNPIASDDEHDSNPHILVLSLKRGVQKITEVELASMHDRAEKLILRLGQVILRPE